MKTIGRRTITLVGILAAVLFALTPAYGYLIDLEPAETWNAESHGSGFTPVGTDRFSPVGTETGHGGLIDLQPAETWIPESYEKPENPGANKGKRGGLIDLQPAESTH